jgi:hypothetical protein
MEMTRFDLLARIHVTERKGIGPARGFGQELALGWIPLDQISADGGTN